MDKSIDLRLKAPFTAIISGPTGSGKTVALMRLIELSQSITNPPPEEIIYCYGVWQDIFDKVNGVRFHRGMLNVEDDIERDGKHRWLIVDDLMDEVAGKEQGNALFTKFSHHLKISVFFVVQNLFHKNLRTISINSHYFFLFKNPRDGTAIANLAAQAFAGKTKAIREVYEDATKKPHSFLLVDLTQSTSEDSRLIGNYLDEIKIVYKING